jgi:DNA-binding transcriptional LysR family regulator
VSQQLSLLQRETGTVLVERHARGVRLTEAGRVLAQHAGSVLSELRAAEAALTAVGQGYGGRLRLGSFTTANAALMPRAVAGFRSAYPDVRLDLTELDSDEGLVAVAEHHVDLALVYEFPIVPMMIPDRVEVLPLLIDPLHILFAAGHPMARRRRLRLADLAEQDWIQGVRHGSTTAVLPQACRAAGFEPRIVFRTDDQMTVRGLVAAGLGIALAPFLALSAVPPGLTDRPLREPDLTRTVMVAVPHPSRRLPAATAMVAELRKAATALGATSA